MTKKTAPKAAPKKSTAKVAKLTVADGSQSLPFPWVEPYPASVIDKEDGKTETVFVRAKLTQAIGYHDGTSRRTYEAGMTVTLPCNLAHDHAAALTSPE